MTKRNYLAAIFNKG